MADFVKEHSAKYEVTSDLQLVERLRKVCNDLVDDKFDPRLIASPSPVIPSQRLMTPISARLPSWRDCRGLGQNNA